VPGYEQVSFWGLQHAAPMLHLARSAARSCERKCAQWSASGPTTSHRHRHLLHRAARAGRTAATVDDGRYCADCRRSCSGELTAPSDASIASQLPRRTHVGLWAQRLSQRNSTAAFSLLLTDVINPTVLTVATTCRARNNRTGPRCCTRDHECNGDGWRRW
jgi:hypothetical protein